MQLRSWVSQNTEQSQSPKKATRSITLSVVPERAGKDAEFAGGKLVGALNLQNVPDDLAAQFAGGEEFDITITPRGV